MTYYWLITCLAYIRDRFRKIEILGCCALCIIPSLASASAVDGAPSSGAICAVRNSTTGALTIAVTAADSDGLNKVSLSFLERDRHLVLCSDQDPERPCVSDAGAWTHSAVGSALPSPTEDEPLSVALWVKDEFGRISLVDQETFVYASVYEKKGQIHGVGGDLGSDRDYALLISSMKYENWENLKYPVSDVCRIGELLDKVYGFRVENMIDPTREEILRKLREIRKMSPAPGSQLLVMFSGHGAFDNEAKTGYFVPREAKSRVDDVTYSSYLSYPLRLLDNMPFNHVLLVVDACFAGTVDVDIAYTGDGIDKFPNDKAFIRGKRSLRSRTYLTSGGNERVPDRSRFAAALIAGLETVGGRNGVLSAEGLFDSYLEDVRPKPYARSFGRLRDPGGKFLFVTRSRHLDEGFPQWRSKLSAEIISRARAAESYCLLGGAPNVERGVQLYREIVSEMKEEDVEMFESEFLKLANTSYHSGNLERACWNYREFFYPKKP